MADEAPVITRVEGGLGRLILNRPKAINALDHEMVRILHRQLSAWADDDSITAVALTGSGERGLCAGGDIVAIHRDASASTGDSVAEASPSARFWWDEYLLNADIARYPKPYIAVMDGIVMGGGVGVSAHGNTRVVTDRTRLAMPETGIGFVPDVGGTHLLAQVPDELGTYAALTAKSVSGADAVVLGLADHYVPADRLDDLLSALATRSVGEALADTAVDPPTSALAAGREWIRDAFAGDSVPEIISRLRSLGTEDATTAADTIEAKSPTAVTVTLRSLRAAADESSLEEALIREYRVSVRCLIHPDLAEGIRAQVIDKDRSPSWRPPTLDAVDAAAVDGFFEPLPDDLTFPSTPREESHA
ncbi:enoyl-CoA hydratase/isomerase family protein [Gordonia soli]|uniref:3-hydroxyisobutyryl-CoA hydrolase n=1 Tax=Gordonia soli NBRC 108243 TaxID=1223545 RepID=M0QQI4_9ACTN|nr:enoyl-CoA hydratase/isomerase family protein [Gordonia soli]GAC70506.1 putative enoyl-CoA hydratase [Gordonia soli NBRC 108243]